MGSTDDMSKSLSRFLIFDQRVAAKMNLMRHYCAAIDRVNRNAVGAQPCHDMRVKATKTIFLFAFSRAAAEAPKSRSLLFAPEANFLAGESRFSLSKGSHAPQP